MPSLSRDGEREGRKRRGEETTGQTWKAPWVPDMGREGIRGGRGRPAKPHRAQSQVVTVSGTVLPGAGQFRERALPDLRQRFQSLKARPSLIPCPTLTILWFPGSSHRNSRAGRAEPGRSGVKVKGSVSAEPCSGPGWNLAVGPGPEGRTPHLSGTKSQVSTVLSASPSRSPPLSLSSISSGKFSVTISSRVASGLFSSFWGSNETNVRCSSPRA